MTSQPKTTDPTPEEYLAFERKAEYKNEYIDGEFVAMSGASRRHNLITVNLGREISQQLKGRTCEAYTGDRRVRIPSKRRYTYPDVLVVCDEPRFGDDYLDTLLNPNVIIEVPSKSTEPSNRPMKFAFYRMIKSLAEYVLVAQHEYRVEQYTKQPDGRWLLSDYCSLEDVVELAPIRCTLTLREVYDKVNPSPSALKEGQLL